MFYKNIVVQKPKDSVVYPHNNYVYFNAQKIYVKEKKHNQNKRVLIGKMINDDQMNPNENAKTYFPDWFENESAPECSDTLSIGNTMIVKKILKDIQLDTLIDSTFDHEAQLIKDLIQYMIIEETTTIQHFPSLMRRLPIFSKQIYSDASIGRLFKEHLSLRGKELFFKAWNQMHQSGPIYISYDSTNINTYGEGIEIAEFGYAKDDDELPIVNLSYAIDQAKGTPLFYELYPGSIPDNSQLTYMIDKAKEYGYEEIGIILDRGYFSSKNIKYIAKAGYDVIMMVKTNQATIQTLLKEYLYQIANKVEYYIETYEVYGKTVKSKLYKDHDKEYYVHIYYDGEKANNQRIMLLNTYQKMEAELTKKTEKTKLNKREDMKRFEKGFKMQFDDNGYLTKYEKRKAKIQKEMDIMGYFVIITSKEMTAAEALETYRDRDSVEKLFRSLKSELDYNRFRVHDETSLENKTFITFLANIVRNEIYVRTKEIRKKHKKDYTVPGIIHELGKVEVTKNSKNEYIRKYGLNKKQKTIMKQFGIEEKEVNQFVKGININQ